MKVRAFTEAQPDPGLTSKNDIQVPNLRAVSFFQPGTHSEHFLRGLKFSGENLRGLKKCLKFLRGLKFMQYSHLRGPKSLKESS